MTDSTEKQQNPKKESFDFDDFKGKAYLELKNGKPLSGKNGVLTPLIKQILEASLQTELETHLDLPEEKHNRKNGYTTMTVKTRHGAVELQNPRDRNSTFDPKIVPKRKTILNESLDEIRAANGCNAPRLSSHLT